MDQIQKQEFIKIQDDLWCRINKNERINFGLFGSVYKCNFYTNQFELLIGDYAVKEVEIDDNNVKNLIIECEILNTVVGKYICEVYHASIINGHMYAITELCDQGTLEEYCSKNNLSYFRLAEIFSQIVEGYFNSIHKNNIIHRNLRLNNILMKDDIPKITGFGFAKVQEYLEVPIEHDITSAPLYTSPQIMIENCAHNYKSDIYSLGVIFYQMVNNNASPNNVQNYTSLKQFLNEIKNNPIEEVLIFQREDVPDVIKQIIYKMMEYDESQRIDIVSLYKETKLLLQLLQNV